MIKQIIDEMTEATPLLFSKPFWVPEMRSSLDSRFVYEHAFAGADYRCGCSMQSVTTRILLSLDRNEGLSRVYYVVKGENHAVQCIRYQSGVVCFTRAGTNTSDNPTSMVARLAPPTNPVKKTVIL